MARSNVSWYRPIVGGRPGSSAPRVRERHLRFLSCPQCDKVFWEGSHWRAMLERLALV